MKNERTRVTIVCAKDGCEWRIHASPTEDKVTFMVKLFNPMHTCSKRKERTPDATSTWIAKKLGPQLKADPELSTKSMRAILWKEYKIEPSYMQIWRARLLAKETNEGNHAKSYAKLPKYGEMVRPTNPACKVGFVNGCRPFIGLDGCHLKGKYGDILLSAIFVDGNNILLPLAFAVVESECKDSWLFFLHNLYTALHSTSDDMGCLTFMSNKQKDLTEAVREVFPDSYTRHCSRHLYANFKIHFPGDKLKSLFWAASSAYRELEFKVALSKMNSIRKDAHDWLSANPPSSWSRWAFDHRAKSGHITNNMTKSFNHWVGPYRDKPILYLIDQLWTCLMEKLHKRFKQACSYKGRLTPKIKKKLDFIYQQSRSCVALSAGHNEFEVNDGASRFVVNLNTRKCGCQVWVATGLPCRHAACCIAYKRERVEDYCDSFYPLGKYMQAYENMIHPLPNILELADTNIMGVVESPPLRRQPGRPPKVRKREDGEPNAGEYKKKSSSVRCDRCKLEGHNKRTYEGGAIRRKRKWSSSKTMQNRNIVGTQTDVNVSQRTRSHNEATDQIDSVQARRREKMAATRARRREKEAMKLQIKD